MREHLTWPCLLICQPPPDVAARRHEQGPVRPVLGLSHPGEYWPALDALVASSGGVYCLRRLRRVA